MNLAFVFLEHQTASVFLEHQTAKSRVLHALFLFPEPRGIVPCKLFDLYIQLFIDNLTFY